VGAVAAGVPATVVALALATPSAQATPSTASTMILAKSAVASTELFGEGTTASGAPWLSTLGTFGASDGYVVDNRFLPGQTTGWHSHPGPSLIFVVSGTITNYDSGAPGCKGKSYAAGSSFTDASGTDVHMLRDDGATPAETIAVQLIPSGEPRRIDKDEPASCKDPAPDPAPLPRDMMRLPRAY
jgi:hypothetical protein